MRNLKKVLALVLAMAMSLSLAVTAGAAFKDDDKIAAEYATAVEFAAQTGILEGFEDGTYGPQKNLTRAQLATMTYRIATGDVEDVYTADFAGGAAAAFTDTAATAWYAGYVGYAADAGYLKGVGDNLYKPNSAMTGYQALAAFLRVVGYNQPGQFTGADWTVQVAMIANEIGALEGIEGVDLNAAISREVAAQIIFNILFANQVEYTPAFGYQDLCGLYGNLAENEFGIEWSTDYAATAPWGRPAQEWYNDEDEAVVSIPYAPVAEYTTAVSECDLADDLGLTEDAEVWWQYINGVDVLYDAREDIINIKHETDVGAQGTLTEVYDIDGEYWFVQIETWLGEITDTTDATYDKKGHMVDAATAELTIYEMYNREYPAVAEIETDDYAVGDFVLVNYSFMDKDNDNGIGEYTFKGNENDVYGFYLTATAPVATGEQTKIDVNKEVSVIGGKTYNWSDHYHYGFSGLLNTEYEVFVDFYGNVIGIQEPAEADPVYTIMNSYVRYTDGYKANYDAAEIVNLTSGALEEITVDTVDGSAPNWGDEITKTVRKIFAYTSDADGYDFVRPDNVVVGESYSVVKGTPRIVADDVTYVTDNYTVFAVEVEDDVFEIYTGYANVPSMTDDAKVEILEDVADDDKKIDLVYIDARNALFAGEEYFAYILPSVKPVAGGALADDTLYETVANVVIDGEVVEVNVQAGKVAEVVGAAGKAVTLKTDDAGLVHAVVPEAGFNYSATIYDENSDEVIYVTNDGEQKSYTVTEDTIIWIVNLADDTVALGSADDVDPGYRISYKLADNGRDVEFIFLFDDTSAWA